MGYRAFLGYRCWLELSCMKDEHCVICRTKNKYLPASRTEGSTVSASAVDLGKSSRRSNTACKMCLAQNSLRGICDKKQ